MSRISQPSLRSRSMPALIFSRTPESMPAPRYSFGIPTLNGFAEHARVIVDRHGGGGRVARIAPGDDFQHRRDVGNVTRERTDAVERRGKGDEAVARNAS